MKNPLRNKWWDQKWKNRISNGSKNDKFENMGSNVGVRIDYRTKSEIFPQNVQQSKQSKAILIPFITKLSFNCGL